MNEPFVVTTDALTALHLSSMGFKKLMMVGEAVFFDNNTKITFSKEDAYYKKIKYTNKLFI